MTHAAHAARPPSEPAADTPSNTPECEYPPTFDGVLAVQERLLSPDGCPWDRRQTPLSLRDMLREECHELLDAIASGSAADAAEETGDALLHILFQIRLSAAAYQRVDAARAHLHYPFTQADAFRIVQQRLTQCLALCSDSGGANGGVPAAICDILDVYRRPDSAAAAATAHDAPINNATAPNAPIRDTPARNAPAHAAPINNATAHDTPIHKSTPATPPPDFASTWALIAELFGAGGGLRHMDASPKALAPLIRRACYALMESVDPIVNGAERPIADAVADALFAVMFAMWQAEQRGEFAAADVFGALIAKLVRRHPHVFGNAVVSDAGEVIAKWHAIKRAEKPANASPLDGAPKSLPALAYAQALQTRAARLAFDWDEYAGVVSKVSEEIDELQAAAAPAERLAEYGDLLFSIVNAVRWLDIDAESALSKWNRQRFRNLTAAAESPSSAAALPAAAVSSLESAIRPGAASALQFAQALQSRLNAADYATCAALDERRLPLPRAFDIAHRLSALGASAAADSRESVRIEAGDILYTAAQAGQLAGLDAEDALRRASVRFYRRFKRMERICRQRGQDFGALPMDAKEALWRQAKAQVAAD